MKNVFTYILYLVLVHTSINTNGQSFHWAFNISAGVVGNEGRSVAVDAQGNVYTASEFSNDLGIHKNDSAGNFIWVYHVTGTFDDVGEAPAIVYDNNGNLYITGSFLNTIDFDAGPAVFNLTATNGAKSYLLKIDSAGHFLWAKMWTSSGGHSRATSIHYNNNYIITCGLYNGIMDFDPGAGVSNSNTNLGQDDAYVIKLDTSGSLIWGAGYGGDSLINWAIDITTDVSDNVIVSGYFGDIVDFDPGPGVYMLIADSTIETYVLRLSSSGNFVWARCTNGMGDNSQCINSGIAVDNSSNIYTSGFYRDSLDFDPGPGIFMQSTTVNQSDCYILKLDSNGNFSWVKTFGSFYNDGANNVTISNQGAVLVTGRICDTTDFDSGPGVFQIIPNGCDIYLLTLTTNGDFVIVKTIGGSGYDEGNNLITDSQDNIYVTGYFSDTVDFNPPFQYNLISVAAADIFTVKYGPVNVGLTAGKLPKEMQINPNPFDGKFSISFESILSGEFIIYNLIGEKIQRKLFDRTNQIECEIEGPPGMYIVVVQTTDTRTSTKAIKY